MFVLGTAGHVDHGKSTLVNALTGTDPDRLPEEKSRGMTIVLGFAWLPLSDGSEVALVDVPGHERFVKTMIAGAGGIDAVLFIIAANEGWMPQTEEHLRILQLLGVEKGIVVITKTDTVDDDWLGLVEEDIAQKLAGTFLESAPVHKVAAPAGTGIDELRAEIEALLKTLPQPRDIGKPRLPIDRVFSMPGMGTVVTGTLTGGSIEQGNEVEIVPTGQRVKIRGIQSHGKTMKRVRPGLRVALNLAGIEKDELDRGQLVTLPGQGRTTRTIEAQIQLLPSEKKSGKPLKSGASLLFHAGTTGTTATLDFFGAAQALPGETVPARITLREPLLLHRGDRFILRYPYPNITAGGGEVIDPYPPRYRKKDAEKAAAFTARSRDAGLADLILLELEKEPCQPYREFLAASPYSFDEIAADIARLQSKGQARIIKPYVAATAWLEDRKKGLVEMVKEGHRNDPLGEGLPSASLASRMKLPIEVFEEIVTSLVNEKKLVRSGALIRSADFKPVLNVNQQEASEKIMALFAANPFAPPSRGELVSQNPAYADVIKYLKDQKNLVELSDGILFRPQDFQAIREKIAGFLKANGPATVSQIREMLGTSRKYVLPVLGRLDEEGFTKRDGDLRSWR
ncbi:MAG: selenocysteine-specific translation elongation factor [Nitrospirota bacterium]|nr:selenocysteine-specific translation elongation factor [Nitrospirota bacterium]